MNEPEESPGSIQFMCDGCAWIAHVSGAGAYGTGGLGLGRVDAVHFAHAEQPERPLREALLARGRFAGLHDAELIALLAGSVQISVPDGG